jgi:UDP-N-acetylglucosamine 2-epimerase (non-hydrolysing)
VFVGNVMIDTLLRARAQARAIGFAASLGLEPGSYVPVTLHRPSNVDDPARLRQLLDQLRAVTAHRAVVWPMHPRASARVAAAGVSLDWARVLPPVSYLHMLDLVDNAHCVVTDSGGLQEETTALGVPCLTVRDTTERPVTVAEGTNTLVRDVRELAGLVAQSARPVSPRRPEGWDGHAGPRVVAALRARTPVPSPLTHAYASTPEPSRSPAT